MSGSYPNIAKEQTRTSTANTKSMKDISELYKITYSIQ